MTDEEAEQELEEAMTELSRAFVQEVRSVGRKEGK